ncbi:hypothetical protein ACHRVZ_17740 [Flavobacterium sp. FlaQc-57]|uniref:hypothetical protein n=1 Tax=Flavobacterium sp. FlaQc-57 TaxID=3374186 RepID=UPI003756A714
MLFPITQINSNLRQIEEIPNTFFQKIQANAVFGYDLFPDWFQEFYGNRTDGLYNKANILFDIIKNSGNEPRIVEGYINSINIESHCLNLSSYLFYCETISQELFEAANDFFSHLFDSFDKKWVTDKTQTNVLKYIKEFKEQNKVFVCPICGNEKIKSSQHEARAALDHWLCKAKYPFSAVNWNNLFPLGEGCNRPPVKGQNEVIWIDNNRLARHSFFYPFNWLGEIEISLECIEEPSIDSLIKGSWKFNFLGINDLHQNLIDKWDIFFGINNRWIDETLNEFIDTWTFTFANYLTQEINFEDFEVRYDEKLISFRNARNSFNVNPQNRVEWFFLNYLINEASASFYNGSKQSVREHLE